MQVLFACPRCQQTNRSLLAAGTDRLSCDCGWSRSVIPTEDGPGECAVCGCGDLWRQKDFPQKLGLFFVALAALLSTLAWWWYHPLWAIGVLLAFAAADLLLFALMKDVLVCYRCGARYRDADPAEVRPFHLETAERYRQEAARLSQMAGAYSLSTAAAPAAPVSADAAPRARN